MFLIKRHGIFYVVYSLTDGRRRKCSTRTGDAKRAQRFLRNFRVEEMEQDRPKRTLKEFEREYVTYQTPLLKPKSIENITLAFKQFIRFRGDVQLQDVTIRDVEGFVSRTITSTSVWSAKKYQVTLAAAFGKAVKWQLLDRNPFAEVRPPKTPDIDHAIISRDEFTRLLEATPTQTYRTLFTLALLTGMRLGEIVNLQWEHVDLERRMIHIRNTEQFKTKNLKNRTVPMNEQLVSLLTPPSSGPVFTCNDRPLTPDVVTKTFKRAVRQSGTNPRIHFHSLRHSFATWMIEKNVNIYTVSKLLGHQSVTTTQKFYTRFDVSLHHEDINRIAV